MAKKVGRETEKDTAVITRKPTENFKILMMTRVCLLVLLLKVGLRHGKTFGSGKTEVMDLECFQ
jgi:hypothetical protein